MNPSLPYVDLVFRLPCPILNLIPSDCRRLKVVEGFPQHGLRTCAKGRSVMLQDRLEAATLFLGHIHLQEHTVKRVNTFKYMGYTLTEDGELDTLVPHSVKNG